MALVYPEDVLKQVEFETISDGWKRWRCWLCEHMKWAARKFRALVKSFGRRWELERVEMNRNDAENGKRVRQGGASHSATCGDTVSRSPPAASVPPLRNHNLWGWSPTVYQASRGSPCPLIFKDHLVTQ